MRLLLNKMPQLKAPNYGRNNWALASILGFLIVKSQVKLFVQKYTYFLATQR